MGRRREPNRLRDTTPEPLANSVRSSLNWLVREDACRDSPTVQPADEARATYPSRLAHDLGKSRDLAGASRPLRVAEQVEHPEREPDQQTARCGWRVRHEFTAAVGGPDGPPPDDPIGRQILTREAPALLLHRAREPLGEVTAVERSFPLLGNLLERRREVSKVKRLPRGEPAGLPVDGTRSRTMAEDRVEHAVQESLRLVQKHATSRQLDRRLEQDRPGQARIEAVGLREPCDGTGYRARRGADQERLRGRSVEGDCDLYHGRSALVRETFSGHPNEEVEHRVGPAPTRRGPMHEQEAPSPRAGQRALRNPGDTGGCNAGVDRVPTLRQDARAGLGGQGMSGRNCALHRKSVDG